MVVTAPLVSTPSEEHTPSVVGSSEVLVRTNAVYSTKVIEPTVVATHG